MAYREESKRQWISGLAITLTALVCLFAFNRLWPDITLAIAVISLIGIIVLFWVTGKQDKD